MPEPAIPTIQDNTAASIHAGSNLADWLSYIEALHPKSIAMGLERVNQVKQRLKLDPVFPIITVAGTNGKGSTCAMLERIYHEAGYKVACYTSPHLLAYNERVRVACLNVSDEHLLLAFNAVENARQDTQLTYFEYGTLAAMCHFMQVGVDVAILEVGLGGRLDAVNAFNPSCCIVTSIALDHVEFLGNSRESIGIEKAGIFRHGVAAICGDANPPSTLIAEAERIGANLALIGRDFVIEANPVEPIPFQSGLIKPSSIESSIAEPISANEQSATWVYTSNFHKPGQATLSSSAMQLPVPALPGRFQLNNAACALTAIDDLQPLLPVTVHAMASGLQKVGLAARFQYHHAKPTVILDVAHNPHAAASLADNLKSTRHHYARTLAVFGMLADKDIPGVIAAVVDEIDGWYVAGISNARGATAQQLAEFVTTQLSAERPFLQQQVAIFKNVTEAYRQACLDAGENDRIMVLGSFFTVAEVMRECLGDAQT